MQGSHGDGAFYVAVIHVDGDALVRLAGEVDIAAQDEILRTVRPLIQPGRPLVLDMSGVTFLDSTGVATVVLLRKATDAAGTSLTVRSNDKVRECLRRAGLDERLVCW